MPYYRLYFLSPKRKIFAFHEFHSEDDEAARVQAQQLSVGGAHSGWELWQEKRRVHPQDASDQAHTTPVPKSPFRSSGPV
jgi:hypothetical protein